MPPAAGNGLLFRQLFDRQSCTYTYLLADADTKEAVLIDPVDTLVERDLKLIDELGLNLTHCLNTHVHADHITGSGLIKERLPKVKSVLGAGAKPAVADQFLADGESLAFGKQSLLALSTPGHTDGCTTFVLGDKSKAFTGDTLFVRGCGRTDFQAGSSDKLYESVHGKIYKLPDECEVWPAHDYKGQTHTTVGEEKRFNPRLTKSKPDFVKLMAELKLADPKKIDVAVPGNMACGYMTEAPGTILPTAAAAARLRLPGAVVLDFRSFDEGEDLPPVCRGVMMDAASLATVPEAVDKAIASGEIPASKTTPLVCYCRSGRRAVVAAERLRALGYLVVANAGGRDDMKAVCMLVNGADECVRMQAEHQAKKAKASQ